MELKYAFMSFSCPDLTFPQILELAENLGYTGVEPRSSSNHKHGVELEANAGAREELKGMAAESGIDICCLATSCRYADPSTTAQNVKDTLEFIDLAADIGSPCLRVFGGKIGGGLNREEAIDLVSNSLRSCADQAEKQRVKICVETHDDWCAPKHLAEVMKRVAHPNICVNWDIMHPVRTAGYTMDEAYDAIAPWVGHVHLHDGAKVDGKMELRPIGEGIIDHKRAAQILKEANYEGFLSGEWIGWEPCEVHLPRELSTMKEIERQLHSHPE